MSTTIRADEKRRCQHCGNSFQPRFEEEHFCCSGCRVVHDLIQSGGFGSFYELLGNRVLQPAEAGGPAADQLADLEEAIIEAEQNRASEQSPAHLRLRIGNLSCTACVWLIDHLFRQHEGALKVTSDTSRSILTLWWKPGDFDVITFVHDLHRYGYPASVLGELDDEGPGESRTLLTRLGVTGGLAMNTMVFTLPSYLGMETTDDLARLFTMVAFASASLALAVGGSYFFQRAISALKVRALHMDVPISLGLAAAYLGSLGGLLFGVEDMLYFDFVATFAFLMLGGRWLHLRLLEKNQRQLWARERDLSATFRISESGERERIPLRRIEEGDLLDIPSGAMLPVEGRLESEAATRTCRFHLDWINGEPEPVPFESGQVIPAGARNGSAGAVRVRASASFAGSFLEQLIGEQPVEMDESESETTRGHPVLKYYLSIVILVAIAGGAGWLLSGAGISDALQVFISVLVVSCPCALGLALPLLNEMLLSKLRQQGIFVRRHTLWSRLRPIRTLAFDKTGTLTEPVKRLQNAEVLDTLESDALQALRRLTVTNHHPVGKALHEAITARFGLGQEAPESAIEEFPGKGVLTRINEAEWRLGRSDWATGNGEHSGDTVFTRNGQPVAAFALEESIRDGAVQQLRGLFQRGFRLLILSGDPDSDRVRKTARELGVPDEDVFANLSPEEKAEKIAEAGTTSTLFMGDGGNDGLAFREAGVAGSPATGIRAIESQADFVFTGRGFHALSLLLDGARRRHSLLFAIFATAILYNIIAVLLCLTGNMNPLLAAVLMPISSIVTTAIATRV